MPFYRFTIPSGGATLQCKADVAAAVTKVHTEVTGAPAVYVHCSFAEVPRDSIFAGGEPVNGGHMVGSIRSGRSVETKRRLVYEIADAWSAVTGEALDTFAIYLHEAPGSQMMEDGVVLPEAGQDDSIR